jgi:putative transposase
MPRQPRLDAPGVLHHVMVRGIERTSLFRDDTDRADFLARLAAQAEGGALIVYAWALLPNHVHILVRTGSRPLARSLRSLLTGYAGAFNRRHNRRGHLVQNRYKSIVVEEEPYHLELVRYIHLNPVRAQVIPDLRALTRYPWTGHSALMGAVPRSWQATDPILAEFGPTLAHARRAYRAFVAAGVALGRRPELQGGGLVRSLGGWATVRTLRRGREAYQADERVLGSSAFVEALRQEVQAATPPVACPPSVAVLIARVCEALGIDPAMLPQGSRRRTLSQAREGIAYLAIERFGLPGVTLAAPLGIRSPSVYKAAKRGYAERERWDSLGELMEKEYKEATSPYSGWRR